MAGITYLNHSLVAAGRVAPAARWSAHHAASLTAMSVTYQVKPSFQDSKAIKAITQPLTEGSS